MDPKEFTKTAMERAKEDEIAARLTEKYGTGDRDASSSDADLDRHTYHIYISEEECTELVTAIESQQKKFQSRINAIEERPSGRATDSMRIEKYEDRIYLLKYVLSQISENAY